MISDLYDIILQAISPLDIVDMACLVYVLKNLYALLRWLLLRFIKQL